MRDFLKAVEHLFEHVSVPVVDTPVEHTDICRVRNWNELKEVCSKSKFGQIRGIFDFDTNQALICDAAHWSHRDLLEATKVRGADFIVHELDYGNGNRISLKENWSMQTDSSIDLLTPAFARLFELSWEEFEQRWNSWVDSFEA